MNVIEFTDIPREGAALSGVSGTRRVSPRGGKVIRLSDHGRRNTYGLSELLGRLGRSPFPAGLLQTSRLVREHGWFYGRDGGSEGIDVLLDAGPGGELVEQVLRGIAGSGTDISPLLFDRQIEVLAASYALCGTSVGFLCRRFEDKLEELTAKLLRYNKYMPDKAGVADSIRAMFRDSALEYSQVLSGAFISTESLLQAEAIYTAADIKAFLIMGYSSRRVHGAMTADGLEGLLQVDRLMLSLLLQHGGLSRAGEAALRSAFAQITDAALGKRGAEGAGRALCGRLDQCGDIYAELNAVLDELGRAEQARPGRVAGTRPDYTERLAWTEHETVFSAYVSLGFLAQYLGQC